MQFIHHTFLVGLLLLATACTKSTEKSTADETIHFDAPDASAAASPSETTDAAMPQAPDMGDDDTGTVCMSDAECGVFCLTQGEGFRDGYCTSYCDEENPCGGGSACVQVDRTQSICLRTCNPSADERECRAGYGCAVDVQLPEPVCIPGCTDDTDCPADRTCDPTSGGNCYNPESTLGDPCDFGSDCQNGAFCFAESWRGWPSGMCVAFGCDPADDAGGGCPTGTVCLDTGRRHGLCVPGCDTDEECRDGYACAATEARPDRLACLPACTDDSQCSGPGATCSEGICR